VVIRPVDSNEIELGDIIAYERNDKLIVHRVVVIDEDYDGSLIFTTRGDSNLEIDRSVHSNQIVGRLYLYVPIVGHPFVFLSSPLGLTLFLLVVGLILVLVYKRTRQSRS